MLVIRNCSQIILPSCQNQNAVLSFLQPLSQSYPGFENWFSSKVVPGVYAGTRHIVTVERDGMIAAIGIGKRDKDESKICTIRVSPSYENKGLGLRVFDDLLEWLETDRPVATVSEEKMPAFQRIFDRYGFKLTGSVNGLYRASKTEYIFNASAN